MQDPQNGTTVKQDVQPHELDAILLELAKRDDLTALDLKILYQQHDNGGLTPAQQQNILKILDQNYSLKRVSITNAQHPGKPLCFEWGFEEHDYYRMNNSYGPGKKRLADWDIAYQIAGKLGRNRFIEYHKGLEQKSDGFPNPFYRAMHNFIEKEYSAHIRDRYWTFPPNVLDDHLQRDGLPVFLELLARRGQQLKGIDLLEVTGSQPTADIFSSLIRFFSDKKRPLPFKEVRLGDLKPKNFTEYLAFIENLPNTSIQKLRIAATYFSHESSSNIDQSQFDQIKCVVEKQAICTEIDLGVSKFSWQTELDAIIARNQRNVKKQRRLAKVPANVDVQVESVEEEQPVTQAEKVIADAIGGEVRRCKKVNSKRKLHMNFQVQQQMEQQVEQHVEQQVDIEHLLEQRVVHDHAEEDIVNNFIHKVIKRDSIEHNVFSKAWLQNLWDDMVGAHNDRVADKKSVIQGLSSTALQQILYTPEQFRFGLDVDNLPAGFYVTTKNGEQVLDYNEQRALSVAPSVFRHNVADASEFHSFRERLANKYDYENPADIPHMPRDLLLQSQPPWLYEQYAKTINAINDEISKHHKQNDFVKHYIDLMLIGEEQFKAIQKQSENALDVIGAMLKIYQFSRRHNIPMVDGERDDSFLFGNQKNTRFNAEFEYLLSRSKQFAFGQDREREAFRKAVRTNYKNFVRSIESCKPKEAFLQLLRTEDANLADTIYVQYAEILDQFDYHHFRALSHVVIQEGCVGVDALLEMLILIKNHTTTSGDNYYDQFKTIFIDTSTNLYQLMSDEALACFEQLRTLSATELHWFYMLAGQQAAATSSANFVTMFQHFRGFLDELNALGVTLPEECRINSTKNFQVALHRLQFIVKNSIYPQAQLDAVNGMSLDQYSAYYAARYDGYYFVAPEMKLSVNEIPADEPIKYSSKDKAMAVYGYGIHDETGFFRHCGQKAYARSFDYYRDLVAELKQKNLVDRYRYRSLYEVLAATTVGQRVYSKLPENHQSLVNRIANMPENEDPDYYSCLAATLTIGKPKVSLVEFLTIYERLKGVQPVSSTIRMGHGLRAMINKYHEYFLASIDRTKQFSAAMSLKTYLRRVEDLNEFNDLAKQQQERLVFVLASCYDDTTAEQVAALEDALISVGSHEQQNQLLTIFASLLPKKQGTALNIEHLTQAVKAAAKSADKSDVAMYAIVVKELPYVTVGKNPYAELFVDADLNELSKQFKQLLPAKELRTVLVFLLQHYPAATPQHYGNFIGNLAQMRSKFANAVLLLLDAAEKVIPGLRNFSIDQSTELLTVFADYFKTKNVVAPKVFSGVLLTESLQLTQPEFQTFINNLDTLLKFDQFSEQQMQHAMRMLLKVNAKIHSGEVDLMAFLKFLNTSTQARLTDCALSALEPIAQDPTQLNEFSSALIALHSKGVDEQYLAAFLHRFSASSNMLELLTLLNGCPVDRIEKLIVVMVHLGDQYDIDTLAKLAKIETAQFDLIADLYISKPKPSAETLKGLLEEGGDIHEKIVAFECNPYGDRDLEAQFATDRVVPVLFGISDPSTGHKLDVNAQHNLLDDFRFVQYIGKRYFAQQSVAQLQQQFKKCAECLQSDPENRRARLALLALAREVLYRTNNLFANSTQMLALIHQLNSGQHVSMEMDTGEGKTLVSAIGALYGWIETGHHDVSTSSLGLAERDCENFSGFFQYFGIPTDVITVDSPLDSYKTPGIHYSDRGNLALFRSRCRFEGGIIPEKKSLTLDEADDAIFDDGTRYNYAMNISGDNDPYFNPYAWVYPLLNDYIDSDQFKNQQATIQDDITNAFAYLKERANSQQDAQLDQFISASQIDRWIESAVAARDDVKQNVDYVITREHRMINGHEQPIFQARILVTGRPNIHAQWSYGVHQCLSARLNQNKTDDSVLDFPIDPERAFVDSTTIKDFLLEYQKGRIIAMSGTTGSKAELQEAKEKYQFTTIKVPSHFENKRVDLPVRFAKNRQAQFDYLIKQARVCQKAGQPLLIIARDIEESEALYEAIKEQGLSMTEVQFVNARQGDERRAVDKAGQDGMVTDSTDMLARGVDIHTDNPDGLLQMGSHFTDYRRVRQQQGRAGRQGQKGTTQLVINSEDFDRVQGNKKFRGKRKHLYTTEQLFENIRHERFKRQQKQRYVREKLGDIRAKVAHEFYSMLPAINASGEEQKYNCMRDWNELLTEFDGKWHVMFDETSKSDDLYIAEVSELDAKLKVFEKFAEEKWQALKQALNERIPATVQQDVEVKQPERKDFKINNGKQEKVPLQVQDRYNPAHDGRPVVYSKPFESILAIFRGERKLFANFRAARRGEGVMFANFRSFFSGDMPFLASIRAWFKRIFSRVSVKRKQRVEAEKQQQFEVTKPESESTYAGWYQSIFEGAELLHNEPEIKSAGDIVDAVKEKTSAITQAPVVEVTEQRDPTSPTIV